MGMTIFLTGGTGALGIPLLEELLANSTCERIIVLLRPRSIPDEELLRILAKRTENNANTAAEKLEFVRGDITLAGFGLSGTQLSDLGKRVTAIVHAASDTRFKAPEHEAYAANVAGTKNVLEFARQLKALTQAVLLSTTCVSGRQSGTISEKVLLEDRSFVNIYEKTKWEAELCAREFELPLRVIRLSTVIGNAKDGWIHRKGAFHYSLQWMFRGFIPMVPGTPGTPIDFISSELAASFVSRILERPCSGFSVAQLAAGTHAPSLTGVIDTVCRVFAEQSPAWQRGIRTSPVIVDQGTFEDFRHSVHLSGNALLNRVLDSVTSFLPTLEYPRTYETSRAQEMYGGELPLPAWQDLLRTVAKNAAQESTFRA